MHLTGKQNNSTDHLVAKKGSIADFRLVKKGKVSDILVDPEDNKTVLFTARLFSDDIQ